MGTVRYCLDAHLGQIIWDKDGVVDWCNIPMIRICETFEFKGFFDIRREIHQTFPSAPNHVRTWHKASASKWKSPFFFGWQDSTLTFLKSPPQILCARFRCMTSFASQSPWIFILTSVNHTFSPRASQHLYSSLHLTNPCTEPNGSQPN